MRHLDVTRAAGALVALAYASSGCSLTADLDSLTAGGDLPAHTESTGGASETQRSDGGCSDGACEATSAAASSTDEARASSLPLADAGTAGPTPIATLSDANSTSSRDTSHTSMSDGAPTSDEDTAKPPTAGSNAETSAPPDTGSCGNATCEPGTKVVHRYSFTTPATTIVDSIGRADGTVSGVVTERAGSFVFDGDTYISLPAEVLTGRENVTLEAWFTSYDTRNWERVFDLGESSEGSGKSYLFFTAQTPSANGTMRVTFRAEGEAEVIVNSVEAARDDVATHVAVVFDSSENEIRLYHDGELSAAASTPNSLLDVNIANVWLGRSLFDSDPGFRGEIDEFRVYDGALDDTRVTASFDAGPDATAP